MLLREQAPKLRGTIESGLHCAQESDTYVQELYLVTGFHGVKYWFTRQGTDWGAPMDKPFGSLDAAIIHVLDPISAVVMKLLTPEQVAMPAGIAGMIALLKPV